MSASPRDLVLLLALCAVAVLVTFFMADVGKRVAPPSVPGGRSTSAEGGPALIGRTPAAPSGKAPKTAPSFDLPLAALRRAAQGNDPGALEAAISALSEVLCAHPDEAEGLLAMAREDAGNASKWASCLVVAMGRCGENAAWTALLRLVEDPKAPAFLRDVAILSLGQRREARLEHRAGPAFAKYDTHVDGPIEEPLVRSTLLRVLRAEVASESVARPDAVQNALMALGGSAGIDSEVFDEFVSIAEKNEGLAPLVLVAMRHCGQSTEVADYANSLPRREGVSRQTVSAAVALLAGSDPRRGLELALFLLTDPAYPPELKESVIEGAANVPQLDVRDCSRLGDVAIVAWDWAKSHAQILLPSSATGNAEAGPLSGPTAMDPRGSALSLLRACLLRCDSLPPALEGRVVEGVLWFVRNVEARIASRAERNIADMVRRSPTSLSRSLLAATPSAALTPGQVSMILGGVRQAISDLQILRDLSPLVDSILDGLPAEARESLQRKWQ